MPAVPVTNAFTIDVEDYFQVSAFSPHIPRSEWDARECRVERNVERILQMLRRHQVQATFFTLGWIAQRYPQVVRDIVAEGHELASHGCNHERASDLTPQAFYEDVYRAKSLHRAHQPVGLRRAPARGLPLQLQRLPDRA